MHKSTFLIGTQTGLEGEFADCRMVIIAIATLVTTMPVFTSKLKEFGTTFRVIQFTFVAFDHFVTPKAMGTFPRLISRTNSLV